ncbi:hypothetical protein D3C79_1118540 [compost metagenome]
MSRGLHCNDAKIGAAIGDRSNHRRSHPLFDIKIDGRVQLGETGQVLWQELR